MNLIIDDLYESCETVQTIDISTDRRIICFNNVVDAVAGLPSIPQRADFMALTIEEAARYLHNNFAGDAIFVLLYREHFAIVRPAFSECPAFYRHTRDGLKVWSTLDSSGPLSSGTPAFNLSYLSLSMRNWSWVTPQTGLQDVFELISGGVVFFDGRRLWQEDLLAEHVAKLPHALAESYDEQVEIFRALILNSVHHKLQNSIYNTSILCSGGVDSSVGALAAREVFPDQNFNLIHGYSDDYPEGDERYYYKVMGRALGWPTYEVDTAALESRTQFAPELMVPTVRPVKTAAAIPTMASLKSRAAGLGASTLLSGDGGDQLFLLNDPLLFSAEILAEQDTVSSKVAHAAELANAARVSIWGVLKQLARPERQNDLRSRYFGSRKFPAVPFSEAIAPAGMNLVPEGEQLSRVSLSRAYQFFGMRNAELNQVPVKGINVREKKTFLFWPLIRAAIQAKRCHHAKDGRDRSLERDAFKSELPTQIYHRHSKGGSLPVVARYDFVAIMESLRHSAADRAGIIPPRMLHLAGSEINDEIASALITARGVSDWMELHD